MNRLFVVFLILSYNIIVVAQTDIDSLKIELLTTNDNGSKFQIYRNIAKAFADVNSDSANAYLEKARDLMSDIDDEKEIASYYIVNGIILMNTTQNDSALKVLHKSLQIANDLDDQDLKIKSCSQIASAHFNLLNSDSAYFYYSKTLSLSDSLENPVSYAACLNNIANVYDAENNKVEALNYYLRALKIFQQLDLIKESAITKNNIALIYHNIGQFQPAIKFAKEASKNNIEVNNIRRLLSDYNTLTLIYRDLEIYDSARHFIRKAIHISEESNFIYSLAQSLHNLGSIYFNEDKYDSAAICFSKSLEICKDNNIIEGSIFNLIYLGQTSTKLNKYIKSEKYLEEALILSDSLSMELEVYRDIIESFRKLYQAKGDFKTALEYYAKYQILDDSLDNQLKANEIQDLRTKYETEQKELENQNLKIENQNQELVISRQRTIIMVSIMVAIIVVLLLIFILSIRKNRKQRLKILEEKNKKIEEQSKELDKLNKTKDKLFSIISHDLRSPFSALLGFVSIIENELKNENYDDALKFTEQLYVSTKSTYDLLENLLSWSRSQQDKIIIEKTQFDLKFIVDKLVVSLKPIADNKSVILANRVPANTLITSDKNILSVILRNLISNSIKFSHKGGEIEIISSFVSNNSLKIIIRDTGVGMSEQLIAKIEKTESVFSTIGTHEEEGTGLGLLMVKEFLSRLDSKLYVKRVG